MHNLNIKTPITNKHTLEEFEDKWIDSIKDYEYAITFRSHAYDPEGLNIENDDSLITYVGTYDELHDFLKQRSYQSCRGFSRVDLIKYDDNLLEIYDYNNQCYFTYTLIENPHYIEMDKGRSI